MIEIKLPAVCDAATMEDVRACLVAAANDDRQVMINAAEVGRIGGYGVALLAMAARDLKGRLVIDGPSAAFAAAWSLARGGDAA